MYDNIGEKIKGLSVTTAVLTAFASIITGIVFMCEGGSLFISGLLIAVIGSFGAWVSSWLLYGFGELIVQTTNNVYYTEKMSSMRNELKAIKQMLGENNEMQKVRVAEENELPEKKHEQPERKQEQPEKKQEQLEKKQEQSEKKQEQPTKKVKISELSYLKIDNEVEKKVYPPNTFYDNGWWKCGNCGIENAPYCNSCSCGNTKNQIITK